MEDQVCWRRGEVLANQLHHSFYRILVFPCHLLIIIALRGELIWLHSLPCCSSGGSAGESFWSPCCPFIHSTSFSITLFVPAPHSQLRHPSSTRPTHSFSHWRSHSDTIIERTQLELHFIGITKPTKHSKILRNIFKNISRTQLYLYYYYGEKTRSK